MTEAYTTVIGYSDRDKNRNESSKNQGHYEKIMGIIIDFTSTYVCTVTLRLHLVHTSLKSFSLESHHRPTLPTSNQQPTHPSNFD
jgi:hypothetical protein